MKKAALAVFVISIFLVSIAAGIQNIEEAKAGSIPTTPPTVTIINPATSSTQSNDVTVVFNVTFYNVTFLGTIMPYRIEFKYRLDNQPSTSIKPTTTFSNRTQNSELRQCKFTLLNLSDGPHNIQVLAKIGKTRSTDGDVTWNFVGIEGYSIPVNFTVTTPPSITILSIQNTTYYQVSVPLNFTLDEPASWIGYSLDNAANATLSGNRTISNFMAGDHNIVIYANDTAGNMGKSSTVFFTIAQPIPTPTEKPSISPTPSPTQQPTIEQSQMPSIHGPPPTFTILHVLAGITIATIIIAMIAVIYYRRRRK